tara:strand:+ start:1214 stop:1570 length:357 start_codon:yes stop_codon:yes gene_type:complete
MGRSKYKVAPSDQRRADGRTFGSKAEKDYYLELKAGREAGIYHEVVCQPKVHLVEGYNVVWDFLVVPVVAAPFYVDVKGVETAMFKRHKKMWLAHGWLDLHIVKRSGRKFTTTEVVSP